MKNKTIVILGGGVGGIVAANHLRRLLPSSHRIMLIERNPVHAFAPSFLWVMSGTRQARHVIRPLASLVRPGVEVVHAEVTNIDTNRRSVTTTSELIAYEYLVIALGAELAPETIPGLAKAAHSFYTLEGSETLSRVLDRFNGGKVAVVVCSMPYKCPGAPHEGAMLIADHFRRRGIADRADVHLYTPEPQPMPVAGVQLGEAVTQMLASRRISFHPLHKLRSVDGQTKTLVFDGKDPARYDLLVAIPPHRAPHVVRESGLTNEAGWLPADRSTLKTKHENVFAIGDITAIGIPGRWKPDVPMMLPKAGVFAHAQAEIVAERIADEMSGRTPTAEFCGPGYCMLEAGEGLAGFAYGDFYAEPSPTLELRKLGSTWHLGKVLFEQWWLAPPGLRKSLLRTVLKIGMKMLRIPVSV